MLPKYYAIKCPKDYRGDKDWKKYVDYINKVHGRSVGGDGTENYYGINDNGNFDYTTRRTIFSKATIFSSAKEFFELLEGNSIHEVW